MEMTGDYVIAAPRARVWAALNDPEVLRRSIDGCESLEKTSDTSFAAIVGEGAPAGGVAPPRRRFHVEVDLRWAIVLVAALMALSAWVGVMLGHGANP